jgi:hypothetical protein
MMFIWRFYIKILFFLEFVSKAWHTCKARLMGARPLSCVELMLWVRSVTAVNVSQELYSVACGPNSQISFFKGCIMNDVRFHTKYRNRTHHTQNNGITVPGEYESMTINYYGELRNILKLRYIDRKHVYLFECDWWDIENIMRIQMDKHFTSVNTSHTWHESDPFILAITCQVSQVF